MSKSLNCAISTVERRTVELGLSYEKKTLRRWTEEEIKQAENLFKLGKSYAEIAEALGRTTKAVGAKADEIGYQKRKIKSKNNGGEDNG